MADMKAVDLKLIGDLFGTGYVMDFTNRTYADFFRDEIGVDIYDDAYAESGNSKGKRLRTFMQRGQRTAIIKALHGLWEYRVAYIADTEDNVPDSRVRLNALLERLGGMQPPLDPNEWSKPLTSPSKQEPSERVLVQLEADFLALHNMDDVPHARGYSFERFLIRWFDSWGLEPRKGFRIIGEQIDGSFEHRNTIYFMEAKWRSMRTNAADLRSFQELVGQHFEGARGLFISYSGFTPDALQSFVARRVVMMDGMDVYESLSRRISLDEVVAKKLRIAVEERRANVSVRELFP